MPSAITNSLRVLNSDALAASISSKPTYVYIGKSTPWPDDLVPPAVAGESANYLNVANDILGIKKIQATNICSVIPRYSWTSGVVYDFFDHRIDITENRKQDGTKYKFYVMTDEFHVYKCLSNSLGGPSTVKPSSNQITPFQTPDGYIWKYMYTVRVGDVANFLTQDWVPIYSLSVNDGSAQWNVQQSAVVGGIHHVVVTDPGSGYLVATPPIITISGDGTGATATAVVNSVTGKIDKIIIGNPGINYTTATVTIGGGGGATATAILSPLKGHGSNAKAELGGYHKMIKIDLVGDEGGKLPITSFRQTGLLHKPLSNALGANMILDSTSGLQSGQTVTGSSSGATGNIMLVESDVNRIWLSGVTGDFVQNETFTVNGVTRSVLNVTNDTNIVFNLPAGSATDIVKHTGEFLYMSNRTPIVRSVEQTEEVRMVITF